MNKDPYNKYIHKIDRDNNMGLVRYILAFGVLIAHFNILCGANIPWIVTNYDRVGGFFAISGFLLISPILKGISFKEFAIRRVWRIVPSYLFVVLGFAIVLSLFSTYSFKEYFSSIGFWKYLCANLTFLNFLHPDLPGVFLGFENPAVNGALWTMKVEWQLTLSVPFIIFILRKYNCDLRKSIILILLVSLFYRITFYILYNLTEKDIYEILGRQFIGQSLYFYGGIFVYTFYNEFIKKKTLFIILSTIIYIIFRCVDYVPFYYQLIHPFVITLLVISYSVIPGQWASIIDRGHNISYEIYLCHFPIMQILAYFNIISKIGVALSLCLGIGLTILFAIITYLCVGHLYLSHRTRSITSVPVKS